MIDRALETISENLDQHLHLKFRHGDLVLLSNILTQDGSLPAPNQDKILMTVVNIEEDNTSQNFQTRAASSPGQVIPRPDSRLIISLLVSVSHSENKYTEGLALLSSTIDFFRKKNVFTHQNTPGLSGKITKMTIEQTSLNLDQVNQLWSSLRARYMPSVLFKIRLLVLNGETPQEILPEVSMISNRS